MSARQGQRSETVDPIGRALLHEVGNLLAASRLNAHFLADPLAGSERRRMACEVQLLSAQAGALLQLLRWLRFGAAPAKDASGSPARLLRGVADALSECHTGPRLVVAAGRGLPELRVEPEILHFCLLALVGDALLATAPEGRVQVRASTAGARVILSVRDSAAPVRLPRSGAPAPRGRELTLGAVAQVLRAAGGRLAPGSRPRSNQQDLLVPVRRARSRS